MKNRILPLAAIVAALAALALTACGGGGDSQPLPGQPAPADPVVSGPPAVPAGKPVAYAAGSASGLALDTMNAAITRCGYPAMAPVTDLTGSARAHVKYIALNNALGHVEDQSLPGFTGVHISDRVLAAGGTPERAAAASEVAGSISAWQGRASLGLLEAPYHMAGILGSWTEAGVGTAPEVLDMQADAAWLVIDLGGERLNTVSKNEVRTYPCEGTVNVAGRGGPETPDPLPGLSGEFGPAVNFETEKSGIIDVDSVSLRSVATGQMIELARIDDYNLAADKFRAVFVPKQVLTPGSYMVQAHGATYASTNANESPAAWTKEFTYRVDF